MGKISMQLAVYSRCQAYDLSTGARSDVTVDQDRGIVCHLPAGKGTCDLYWVDIKAGWAAVSLAGAVRDWRKRKDLHHPLSPYSHTETGLLDPDPILTAIAAATEVGQLRELWAANHAFRWEARHTEAAAIRKAQIRDDIQGVLT